MSEFNKACQNGDIKTVTKYLSDKYFKGLNEKDNYGNTPFLWACYNGHKEIVELLIKTKDLVL